MSNYAVSRSEVSINKEKFGIASCNICFARNYEADDKNALGEYKKNLYNLHIGNMCICLCKDCLLLIASRITSFIVEEAENAEEE